MADPNPYVDSGPWGTAELGGLLLPGLILSIDGADRPEEWDVQKPTEKSGGATVWKGTKLADSIKIALALYDEAEFEGYNQLRRVLRPEPGQKPPTHTIVNGIINFNEITRVSLRNIAAPKWEKSGGYWKGEITLIDFSPPKPANTGAAGPAKPGSSGDGDDKPDPLAQHRAYRDELAKRVKKALR